MKGSLFINFCERRHFCNYLDYIFNVMQSNGITAKMSTYLVFNIRPLNRYILVTERDTPFYLSI